jgi:hypothetical protein
MKEYYRGFLVCSIIYTIVFLIVDEAPIYWVGGVLVGTVMGILNVNSVIGISISFLVLLGVIWLYFKVQLKALRFSIIVLIFLLLYLLDISLSSLITHEIGIKQYYVLGLAVILKSAILSFIISRDKILGVKVKSK